MRVRVDGAARGERRHGAALAQRARAAGQLREPQEHAERRARRREARGGGGGGQNHVRQVGALRGGEAVANHSGARQRARQRARRGVGDERRLERRLRPRDAEPTRGSVFVREGGADAGVPGARPGVGAKSSRQTVPARSEGAAGPGAGAFARGASRGGRRGEQRLGDGERGGARRVVHRRVDDVSSQHVHQTHGVAAQERANASLELVLRARGGSRRATRASRLDRNVRRAGVRLLGARSRPAGETRATRATVRVVAAEPARGSATRALRDGSLRAPLREPQHRAGEPPGGASRARVLQKRQQRLVRARARVDVQRDAVRVPERSLRDGTERAGVAFARAPPQRAEQAAKQRLAPARVQRRGRARRPETVRGERRGVDDAGAGRAAAHRRVQRAGRRRGGARGPVALLAKKSLRRLLRRVRAHADVGLRAVPQAGEQRRGEPRERRVQRAPPRVPAAVPEAEGPGAFPRAKNRFGRLRQARQDALREREEHIRRVRAAVGVCGFKKFFHVRLAVVHVV